MSHLKNLTADSFLAPVKAICEDYENNHPEVKRTPKEPLIKENWREIERMQNSFEPEPRDFNGGDGDND